MEMDGLRYAFIPPLPSHEVTDTQSSWGGGNPVAPSYFITVPDLSTVLELNIVHGASC
ncbi:hypothetical protein VTH82DRAFT_10 [Thermothelomyces myriococcoides]